MDKKETFIRTIETGYSFEGPSIVLGGAMYDQQPINGLHVRLPLATLNRHGLIAGATGTGKTKTLQILAEQLSKQGVPSLVMDIKGDLSGIAQPSPGHPKIDERHQLIGLPFTPSASPVELLTLSNEPGARLRATIAEFGPILLSKILGLNETQSGIMAVVFKFAEDNEMPLLDLKDLKKTLQYLANEGKEIFRAQYGTFSSASLGAIMRRIVALEQQDADLFFGEPSFDTDDLLRLDEQGRGIVHVLRVTDLQDRPKLFSTFMLQLLAELYSTMPEEGDLDQPKLVLFIDEAHLIFDEASDVLLDQIEAIIKLIRSKGIGVFFVTQNPTDIPEVVLSQLGLKIQHALRAFTAKDRKAIKEAAANYPLTEFYDVPSLLTQLGIGEALVTTLNEKGHPTPLVHTLLRAPESRMDILTEEEIRQLVSQSYLAGKYNRPIDRESAYEILQQKIEEAQSTAHRKALLSQREKAAKVVRPRTQSRKERSLLEEVMGSSLARQIGRTVARELTRGLLGVLGVSSSRRRSRRTRKRSSRR